MFVLRETPRDEDLELVVHWIDDRGRHWPSDDEDRPLDPETKKPMLLDDTGLPKKTDKAVPNRLRFWLKMLTGPESNAITEAILSMRTKRTRVKRNTQIEVESDISIALAAKLKLKVGITKWDGIFMENGKPAPMDDKHLDLLPAWLMDDLVDRITALTTITEDEEGE